MEEKLKKYGLKVYQSDAEDREPIDFSIADDEDNVCWVWGSGPFTDVQIECTHPEVCVEWGDDDEQGVCKLCGATCDWHWVNTVVNEGHDDEGNYYCYEGKEREVTMVHTPKEIGGIVGEYLKELRSRW